MKSITDSKVLKVLPINFQYLTVKVIKTEQTKSNTIKIDFYGTNEYLTNSFTKPISTIINYNQ